MIPSHIAFIMDGNGRWAIKRHRPRKYGHKMGTDTMRQTIDNCVAKGIKYVTFYAFSTENWSRPKEEIDGIFDIIRKFFDKIEDFKKNGYRVKFLGNLSALPNDIFLACTRVEQETLMNEKITICIALNYGSWEEVIGAVNRLISSNVKVVTKEILNDALYTAGVPFPDVIVRTGGEIRLSNFLLLQSAYAELIFTDVLWPDFNEIELDKVLCEFGNRHRKYGGLEVK